jgi:hypothetical protein
MQVIRLLTTRKTSVNLCYPLALTASLLKFRIWKPQENKKSLIMKSIFLIIVALTVSAIAEAQTSTGTQTMSMTTGNSVSITFTGTSSATGNTVSLPFTTATNYANGKTSTAQTMQVVSNKAFNVTVKTASPNFTYSGSTSPAPSMPVNGILKLKVSSNATGGIIAAPFSAFGTLTASNQNLITNGVTGTNQLFSVKYKAAPGFDYPAGIYTVDVIYTATQL